MDDSSADLKEKLVLPEGDENSRKLVGLLSNYEVYQFFKETKEKEANSRSRQPKWKSNTPLNTVSYEVLQYLRNTPCVNQNPEMIESFLSRMIPFNLTKAEVLMILNTRPTQPVDIQAIVEESEERLTEDQIDDILNIIEQTLPVPTSADEEEKHDVSHDS